MSEPVIRRTTASDVQILAALRRADSIERRSVSPDADPAFETRFAEWAATVNDGSVAWLAECDGKPVGMLHMFVHQRMPAVDRSTPGWGYIGVFFVVAEHRNAGLGGRLLDTAFGYAKECGFSRILLHPTDRAVPLYRRAGFDPADQYLVWSASS